MELTERLLNDAGGWQIMKQARGLHEGGRVRDAQWVPPLLEGRVREGETEFRSGLKILSKSNVENVCGCRMSRQHGQICAHSVAVGLAVLKPIAPPIPVAIPAPAVALARKGPIFSVTEGEGITLYFIFPPNFATAWERGVSAGAEAVLATGRRLLLSALDEAATYQCAPEDLRAGEALREIAGGTLPGMAVLTADQMLRWLPALADHPRVTLGRGAKIDVSGEAVRPRLHLELNGTSGLRLGCELPAGSKALFGNVPPWLLTGTKLQPLAPGLPAAYQTLLQREITLDADQAAAFLANELPALASSLDFDRAAVPGLAAPLAPPKPAWTLHLEGSLNHLTARLDARYGDQTITIASTPGRSVLRRNAAAEEECSNRLRQTGFEGPDARGEWVLRGEPRTLRFFAIDLPVWQRDIKVVIGQRFAHVTKHVERVSPQMEVRSSGESWFDLHLELGTPGGDRFSAAEIQRLLQSGQTSARRAGGKIAVWDPAMLDEFEHLLRDCDPQQRQPGVYRFDQRHAAYLSSVATSTGASLEAPRDWREWAEAPRTLDRLTPVPLGNLEETLRPYQKQGVYWMNFLARNNLAGVLADEMGLGKTLQTLALIRVLGGKTLVVCPSTLVRNWEREAARFIPDRTVLVIEGPNRAPLFGEPLRAADLIVTSYALLVRDFDRYRDLEFTTVILDEAQHIKNPNTQNAQSTFRLRATHRFALTGTPIENSLRDIWSLLNFLMPGYLGTQADFRERFEKPLEKVAGGPEKRRLIQRLSPFILRRTKKEVLPELPDKVEQVVLCELTTEQKKLYSGLLEQARTQASQLAGERDQGKARMAMLTALLRLRQTCCDLRLMAPDVAPAEASGKLDLMDELLDEIVDGDHRVLIFSQFVGMLALIRERLEAREMAFCYLDGSTKKRMDVVDRFQTGQVPAFLISLKAGGVGLNLTAADTVIHFEPWWNPAVEDQATDRAHRIGQRKSVTAYKLIAEGTVEQKILALQQRKRELSDLSVESEEPLMQGLGMDEIQELLR